MKLKLKILMICCVIFTCQNNEDDFREDWVKNIENSLSIYNKDAKVKYTKVFKEQNEEYTVQFYNKDEIGLQLIKTILNDNNFIDLIIEQYLLNDDIVSDKMTGTFPFIYKGTKKITDPCCEMFDKLIYYKNPTEGKVYTKTLRIMNMDDKDEYINDLYSLVYEESEKFDILKEFDRSNTWLEEIKENLK